MLLGLGLRRPGTRAPGRVRAVCGWLEPEAFGSVLGGSRALRAPKLQPTLRGSLRILWGVALYVHPWPTIQAASSL